jgi:hypothetical protein
MSAVETTAEPPIRATPTAPPTWRAVLLTAAAMPARSGPSASVAPATSAGSANPHAGSGERQERPANRVVGAVGEQRRAEVAGTAGQQTETGGQAGADDTDETP